MCARVEETIKLSLQAFLGASVRGKGRAVLTQQALTCRRNHESAVTLSEVLLGIPHAVGSLGGDHGCISGSWPCAGRFPPLAVPICCAVTGIAVARSVISLPSSFWCPQVLQFPLLSLSNSAHVRTLINQCQVTECTTRAVFFNCPLSPHTSHCSKKLIQMARKQPMQHIKEMRQK